MRLDLDVLAQGCAHIFGTKTLRSYQLDGLAAIALAYDEYGRGKAEDLAYMYAIAAHETALTMQPVIETRQGSELQNPSVDEAIRRLEKAWTKGRLSWVKKPYWRKDADGLSWLGRGYPQVTHKVNYVKAEMLTGVSFTKNPDLMLNSTNAAKVMVIMMLNGGFTGHKLSEYFSDGHSDPYNARRIINGTESAAKVAAFYTQFLPAVTAAIAAYKANASKTILVGQPAPEPGLLPPPPVPIALPASPPAPSIAPEPPAPSLAKSKIVQASAGIVAGQVVTGIKVASDMANTVSQQVQQSVQQVNGAVQQVTDTVTVVKSNTTSWVGLVSSNLSWPVVLTVLVATTVLAGFIILERGKLKTLFGV